MLRDALGSALARAAAAPIRELVEDALAARELARPAELEAAHARLDALAARSGPAALATATQRIEDVDARLDRLSRKIDMAIGAVQDVTRQVADASRAVELAADRAEAAEVEARRAAHATEAAADRVAEGPPPDQVDVVPTAPQGKGCRVQGCADIHRARGFCGRHYQQWRRGALDGFVAPDGRLVAAGAGHQRVERRLAGLPITRTDGRWVIGGEERAVSGD